MAAIGSLSISPAHTTHARPLATPPYPGHAHIRLATPLNQLTPPNSNSYSCHWFFLHKPRPPPTSRPLGSAHDLQATPTDTKPRPYTS